MGLFKKKNKKDNKKEIPSLPDLPKLPDFPRLEDPETSDLKDSIHQLPGLPSNSLGRKFSQDSIKDAVTGEIRGEGPEVDEFDTEEGMRRIPGPLKRKSMTEELSEDIKEDEFLEGAKNYKRITREAEPIFIRIDRFEEGLHIFEEIKKKISSIEKILAETRRMKEMEERELHDWEREIRSVKNQIEKIDKDIFSKI